MRTAILLQRRRNVQSNGIPFYVEPMMEAYVKRPGISPKNARLMESVFYQGLARVYEQGAEFAKALQMLEKAGKKDPLDVDRKRLRSKMR